MANEKTRKEKKDFVKKLNITEMPHSAEAERSLLGCLLMDVKIQVETAAFLSPEDFYSEANQTVFNAMSEIIAKNQPVDFVTLSDFLDKKGELDAVGGVEYLINLTETVPSAANSQRYLNIVKRNSMLRKIIRSSAETISDCQESTDEKEALAFAEKKIFDISNSADTSDVARIDKIIPGVMATLDELSNNKSAYRGVRTKFKGIDNLLNGLQKSDLIILAARPSVGKTSLAMNIVENVALQGKTCVVFSLEMGKEQLVQRMMCSVAGVSMEHAMKGIMTREEWLKMAKAREQLAGAKIFIDDSAAITPAEALSKCRRIKRKYGLDLVMVDYIQLMSSGAKRTEENRQQEITAISRNLKLLAKEINVPVLALSQLSRAVEQRKGRPQMSDLRESGAIEQDADIVMFIHRPDKNATEKEISENKVQQNVAEILVEKHRNGPQGMVKLYFKGECTKFLNLNQDGEVEDPDREKHETSENKGQLSEIDSEVTFDIKDEKEPKIAKSIDEEFFG